MLFTTISLLSLPILSLASPIALPQASTCAATSVEIDYYQGTNGIYSGTSSNCGTAVATGNITTSLCNNLYTQGIFVHADAADNCVLSLWRGSTTCAGDATSTFDLTAGGDSVCVYTGVLEPEHYYGSAILTCDC